MSRALVIACLLHVAVSSTYVFSIPVFEGPDEQDHWFYAWELANSGRIPVMRDTAAGLDRPSIDEAGLAHHPPLYYALLASILCATGHDDTLHCCLGNPRALTESPEGSFLWLHGADEGQPASAEIRFFRGLRFLSVACGLVTLLLVWRLGRLTFPRAPAVADVAVFLLAALPGWSFNHGVMENDCLAATLGHAALVVLCGAIAAARLEARTALTAALLLGLGLMTKLTTLALVPLFGLVALVGVLKAPNRLRAFGIVALGGLVLAAITGWFFVRNDQLYGDLLGSAAHRHVYARGLIREGRVGDWLLTGFFPNIFASLLGLANAWIATPQAVLDTLGKILGACGLAGLLLAVLRPRGEAQRPIVLVLAAAAALVFGATLQFNLTFHQPQGRYLFPAIGPMAILLAAGLVRLVTPLSPRLRSALGITGGAAATGIALFAAALHFQPELSAAVVPAPPLHASLTAHCTARSSTPGIEILTPPDGTRLDSPATLRWRPLDDTSACYAIYVFSPQGRLYLATHEWLHLEIKGGHFTFGATIWDSLPRHTELIWNVRRIPDRSQHESVDTMPLGAGSRFIRVQ